jgi:hypothetical protein
MVRGRSPDLRILVRPRLPSLGDQWRWGALPDYGCRHSHGFGEEAKTPHLTVFPFHLSFLRHLSRRRDTPIEMRKQMGGGEAIRRDNFLSKFGGTR